LKSYFYEFAVESQGGEEAEKERNTNLEFKEWAWSTDLLLSTHAALENCSALQRLGFLICKMMKRLISCLPQRVTTGSNKTL
jgi:hypothetical protein